MSALDNYNYARDPRTQGKVTRPTITLEDGTEFELPMKWAVCPVCDGEGQHVNPSIDAGGLSAEAFYDDPDFAEDYFSGTYDVTCNACEGRTTIPVVDDDALTIEQAALYAGELQADAEYEAERLAEIRAGC